MCSCRNCVCCRHDRHEVVYVVGNVRDSSLREAAVDAVEAAAKAAAKDAAKAAATAATVFRCVHARGFVRPWVRMLVRQAFLKYRGNGLLRPLNFKTSWNP